MVFNVAKKSTTTVVVSNAQNVEDILEGLGGFGRFQVLILVLILMFEIPMGLVVFSPIFTGVHPNDWTCDNETIAKNDICSCNGTLQSTTSSIVSEWSLVCDKAWVSDFITTVQMFGLIFGSSVFGQLADWYGRKYSYLGTIACLVMGTVVSASAPNMYVYAVARFFCGVGYAAFANCSGAYTMEFMPPKWRAICASVGPLGEGIMLLGLLGYYFQDSWRTLLWVSAAPFALIFIAFPFIPESPRWLLRNNQLSEAQKVFNYIARVNGKDPVETEVLKRISDLEGAGKDSAGSAKIGYIEFMKNKEYLFTTCCLMVITTMSVFVYFGISYNLKNMGGDPYWNVVYLGLCDAIGYPVSFIVNMGMSRRNTLAAFMTVSSGFLVVLAILQFVMDVHSFPVLVLSLTMLGKFTAAGARASARTVSGESYPTSVRNMGVGIVWTTPAILGILTPQVAYLGSKWPAVPLFLLAGSSLIGAGASFLLKETKGKPLQE